jgi:hypothetical protein
MARITRQARRAGEAGRGSDLETTLVRGVLSTCGLSAGALARGRGSGQGPGVGSSRSGQRACEHERVAQRKTSPSDSGIGGGLGWPCQDGRAGNPNGARGCTQACWGIGEGAAGR